MIATILRTIVSVALLAGVVLLLRRIRPAAAAKLWLVLFMITVAVATSSMATHSFVAKWAFRGDSPRDGLSALVEGTASRPFVYRRLASDAVGEISDLVLARAPERWKQFMLVESPMARYTASWGEAWNLRKSVMFHVTYLFFWLCLLASFFTGAGMLRAALGLSWFEGTLAAAVGMCLLPLIFCSGGYLYDAPELLLWSALLWVALSGPIWLAPPVFAVMLFNKETAIVVVPALLPLLAARTGLRRALQWCAFLGVMGAAWVFYVRAKYAHLPGDTLAPMLSGNLAYWAKPTSYLSAGSPFAPVLPSARGGNLLLLLLALLPVRFGLPAVKPAFRLTTLIMAGIMLPLFLVGGAFDEVRALLLLLVPLFAVQVAGVKELLRVQRGTEPKAAEPTTEPPKASTDEREVIAQTRSDLRSSAS